MYFKLLSLAVGLYLAASFKYVHSFRCFYVSKSIDALKVVGNEKEGGSERCQTFTICLGPRRSMFFSLLVLLSSLILRISVSAPVEQNE
jgi:hypothetical protein